MVGKANKLTKIPWETCNASLKADNLENTTPFLIFCGRVKNHHGRHSTNVRWGYKTEVAKS